MTARNIKGTLEISVVPSAPDPEFEAVTVTVTPEGFIDEAGLGRGGDAATLIPVTDVAEELKSQFDTDVLRAILDHLAKLRALL